MFTRNNRRRGSGLIIALAVLAMLAVMATTFITLARLDVRVAANYVDDARCEMLAHGVLDYFRAILRDDLDRSWGKYENRDTAVGYYSFVWTGAKYLRVPGLGQENYGTPVSNDFWMTSPIATWGDYSFLYQQDYNHNLSTDVIPQITFYCSSGGYGSNLGMVTGRYRDVAAGREHDIWVDRALDARDARGMVVDIDTGAPPITPLDDDADGTPSPPHASDYYECYSEVKTYYDAPPWIQYKGDSGRMLAGKGLTGEGTLPGGTYWRWGAKLGVPHSSYANLNTAGNLYGANTAYLNNMGGIGLAVRRAKDETTDCAPGGSSHLGRMEWRGFSGEYCYNLLYPRCMSVGFPNNYDAVMWHPGQASLERAFYASYYHDSVKPDFTASDPQIDRQKARDLIAYRLGGDGVVADGTDKWRVGWRRDAATYYKLPNPDNPVGDDRVFGSNEAIEHDHPSYHSGVSTLAKILGYPDERNARPLATTWSADTILRGKIWPSEGPPYTSKQGDWRHIDILKRVNLNMIGASGPDGTSGEDSVLKSKWAMKRDHERERLYYMLVAGMRFTNTPNPEQQACQFIASLADMVDRDNLETLYRAPDGSGAWGLGVEKFPVLNEIVFFSGSSANTANYDLTALRIELYNPAHNIPWIPDATEACGIADYRLRITSNAGGSYTCRLGDLKQYGFADPNQEIGMVSMIGADGLYADPNDATQRTWSRLVHCGWTKGTSPLPAQLTRAFLEGGLVFELWKPLSGDAMATPLSTGKVETIDGMPCLCVDRAGGDAPLQLIRSYKPNDPGPSAKQTTYVGCYRRCDPLNARIYGTQGNDDSSVVWGQGSGTTGAGGWTLAHVTLGKPNVGYPQPKDLTKTSVFRYNRMCEREFKVVNGDLPSIGWLGELMMRNVATDGPLTMVHSGPQDPGWWSKSGTYHGNPKADELDCKAKFDLCRPFFPAGKYNPKGTEVNPSNIHMLDIFTVWDPSNDGIDNDGDGAIDDEDTGLQAGDKCGPEMRVFGQLDLNSAPRRVMATIMPNNFDFYMWMSYYNRYVSWTWDWISQSAYFQIMAYRQEKRGSSGTGPYETIGDLLRADSLTLSPGRLMYGGIGSWNNDPAGNMGEGGVNGYYYTDATAAFSGDDDGDGIFDERDERDMLFTWLADFITTRSQVYEIDMNVDVCEPPFYPGNKYPYPAYKSKKSYGRKQVLGILDRSTCLRINPNRTCDFSGPVEVRMLRFSDDLRVH